ncbi:MAG TPA: cohesin domain-containing protein, partial [Bacteroidia bacterium]|nr:cohesin domain-containing protein [Bacteroidia bacterium]
TFYMDNSPNFVAGQNQYNRIYMDQSGGQVICNGSTVKYINFQSGATLDLFNATIGKLLCASSITINQGIGGNGNVIHYAEINGSAWIGYNNSFDTLLFNNAGHSITLAHATTQTINNYVHINASGGFPVSIQSDQAGVPAMISKLADTVCVNYILMRDITAIGGAVYYAGQNSTNISNNTGWYWTSCNYPVSNVWPGDANYDLITNNLDIVYIGMAYGQTGFVRPSASLNYIAQPCADWGTIFSNATDIKNADCDGNGIVDLNDTLVVKQNYMLTHPHSMNVMANTINSAYTSLSFAPVQNSYPAGAWVSIPIQLGTAANPAPLVYGMAFSVHYDPSQIQAGSVSINYAGSWMVNSSNLVHLEKDFYSNARIDVGMSRINHNDVSGNGTIANLVFRVSSTATFSPIGLSFSQVTLLDMNQQQIPVQAVSDSVMVSGIATYQLPVGMSLFPNPCVSEVTVNYSVHIAGPETLKVYTPEGQLISTTVLPDR